MSRPTRGDAPATSIISVRVTPAERVQLELVAKENYQSLTAMMRDALNCFASDYRDEHPVFLPPKVP